MADISGDPQRHVLSRATERPQQLVSDALARIRARFNEDPASPFTSSGEITQPHGPEVGPGDENLLRRLRAEARYRARPDSQFRRLATLECERLEFQEWARHKGRSLTLPFDDTLDHEANAENNIRSHWLELGIWAEEWGPAWPKDSNPMDPSWRDSENYPDKHPFHERVNGCRWCHETRPEDHLLTQPQSDSLFDMAAYIRSECAKVYIRLPPWSSSRYQEVYAPPPTVRVPEASRPLPRFLDEISRERAWIRDEIEFWQPGQSVDLDVLAYNSVKSQWLEYSIWNFDWGKMPGESWAHEEPVDEHVQPYPIASTQIDQQLSPDIQRKQSLDQHRYEDGFLSADTSRGTTGSSAKVSEGDVAAGEIESFVDADAAKITRPSAPQAAASRISRRAHSRTWKEEPRKHGQAKNTSVALRRSARLDEKREKQAAAVTGRGSCKNRNRLGRQLT